jgi:hypothetical protein
MLNHSFNLKHYSITLRKKQRYSLQFYQIAAITITFLRG